ncbi:MAG TPA: transcription antitermination factor NusB, partial [Flavobacterium sp.]|nr:transcription antitermination factor NusB [Flavobacterium sp.]
MLSRRLLRVKVMQMVYAYHQCGDDSIKNIEKSLFHSISKSFELYHLLLLLLVELHKLAANRIEVGRNKKIPSPEELNPNTRFIDNIVIAQISENIYLNKYIDSTGLSWSHSPELVKEIFEEMIKSDVYSKFMDEKSDTYDIQKRFVVKLVEKVIGQYEPLYSQLEEQSVFWNDESEFVVSMVIKTLKEFEVKNGAEQSLLQENGDDDDGAAADDRKFVSTLFRKSILNKESYTELIKQFSHNWDLERVAFMDIVLMHIALTEIIEFPLIPIKVSLNEYIEIAKHYSTPKSGIYINGMLDKISEHLIKEGKIKKKGLEEIKK